MYQITDRYTNTHIQSLLKGMLTLISKVIQAAPKNVVAVEKIKIPILLIVFIQSSVMRP
jgi:hypothetical protein